MRFYMPTRLYSEADCVKNHAAELAALGTHALIVTGSGSSKRNGSLGDVTAALSAHGVGFTVFDRTEENPSVGTVMAARDLGLECGADFVIGIGGGSPIDAAKAAALMIANPGEGWELMYRDIPAEALPLAAVPTTCGTGSEVTGVSIITRHDLRTKGSIKHKMFPKLALVDGKYLMSAPQSVIVSTALDAFSHLIESGANRLSDRCSDMIVTEGLRLWSTCRPVIEGREALDADSALRLMEASSFGGMAIALTGTTVPHAMSYALTYEAGIPHGKAVGVFQANYLRYADSALSSRLLGAAGFKDADELDELVKRIAPVNVSRELLEYAAESVLAKPDKLAVCPYELNRELMIKIAMI